MTKRHSAMISLRASATTMVLRVQFLDWCKKPFPGQGHYEYMRQRAQQLQQRDKPQPTKTVWAIGSMEWLAEQKEAG